jgi:hypothetical protein
MSDNAGSSVEATIARLESKIERLTALVDAGPPRTRRRLRTPMVIAGVAVLSFGTWAGIAAATGSTTSVSFIALTTPKAVLSNTAIATHKSSSPVVIGGTTTVPSNATTVQVKVSAKGTAAGTLNFYPAGNPSGASGQTLAYTTATTPATTTIEENVGQSGELTIYNSGSGSATVTATIIGYSTQVTAGDISGLDGTSGQVLTNNGSGGASWQSPSGGGAATGSLQGNVAVSASGVTVDKISLPAGSFHVVSTYDAYASAPAFVDCEIVSPGLSEAQTSYADVNQLYSGDGRYYGSGTAQALLNTGGGMVSLVCQATQNPNGATVQSEYMIVTPVASSNGVVVH